MIVLRSLWGYVYLSYHELYYICYLVRKLIPVIDYKIFCEYYQSVGIHRTSYDSLMITLMIRVVSCHEVYHMTLFHWKKSLS